ncbi:hypothetical protein ER45_030660 (plasmid) [Bacillus mycoides]|nr:hypothetical protein ER45_030660 [Bacillus mycoides]
MAIKQHSFKCNTANPVEKMINDFLEGKPTQYHLIEAMKTYVRIENAKQAAIDGMISNIENGLFTKPNGQAPQAAPGAKDSIKDFDL